jgi:hypothetical protein
MKHCKYRITNLTDGNVIQNYNFVPARNDFDILIFTEKEYAGKMEETPDDEELHVYSVLQAILNSLCKMSDLTTTRFKIELVGDVEDYDHRAFATLCRNFLDSCHDSGTFPPSMYTTSREDNCFYLGMAQVRPTLH